MCEACAGHARGMREACENRTYTDPVSDPVPDFALDSHPPQLSFLGEIKITCNSSMSTMGKLAHAWDIHVSNCQRFVV